MPENYLSRGNEKLHKSILGWSLTPVKSCPNHAACYKDCYAIGPYNRYPVVKQAWDRNLRLAQANDFKPQIIGQIKRSRSVSAVRIHVAGDFFNQQYLDSWTDIIKSCPNVRFYGYTKTMDLLNFDNMLNLENANIINSITPDGGVNFGDAHRVAHLKKLGYAVCPATVKGNNAVCGLDCKICQYYERVCFHKH